MVKSDGVPSGQQLCAGEEDVGGMALLVALHAGRGREVEEERPPFPFPRGTGSDGERGHGAKLSNLQPWWLPHFSSEIFFREVQREVEMGSGREQRRAAVVGRKEERRWMGRRWLGGGEGAAFLWGRRSR